MSNIGEIAAVEVADHEITFYYEIDGLDPSSGPVASGATSPLRMKDLVSTDSSLFPREQIEALRTRYADEPVWARLRAREVGTDFHDHIVGLLIPRSRIFDSIGVDLPKALASGPLPPRGGETERGVTPEDSASARVRGQVVYPSPCPSPTRGEGTSEHRPSKPNRPENGQNFARLVSEVIEAISSLIGAWRRRRGVWSRSAISMPKHQTQSAHGNVSYGPPAKRHAGEWRNTELKPAEWKSSWAI